MQIVKLLLSNGADHSIKNLKGEKPFDLSQDKKMSRIYEKNLGHKQIKPNGSKFNSNGLKISSSCAEINRKGIKTISNGLKLNSSSKKSYSNGSKAYQNGVTRSTDGVFSPRKETVKSLHKSKK